LSNTRARLERLYGGRAALGLIKSSEGFSVELEFPITTISEVRGEQSSDGNHFSNRG